MLSKLLFSALFLVNLTLGWASPKVFDCFPFFNEFELLKMRLDELNDVVDYFVLVESVETQRGHRKPLYFEENRHLFGPYLHKIIHIALRDVTAKRAEGDWWREHRQRNAIMLGLKKKSSHDDVILISDVDEIPRKAMILRAKDMLQTGLFAVRFRQEMYRHRLNWVQRPGFYQDKWNWLGTIATTYSNLKKHDPQYFRDNRGNGAWGYIHEGGWHFTSMGSNEAIRTKEYSVIEGRDNVSTDAELQEAFKAYMPVPVDTSYPDYVLRNYDYLVSIHLIDPSVDPSF